MLTSYHVHSRWSDGQGEIADLVMAAAKLGLDELGISDHYTLRPDRAQMNWSMRLDLLDRYVEAVQAVMGRRGGPVVRLGLEADYFPETADALADVLASQPFDYVIGSVHFVDGFPIDECAENWERLTQDERDDVIRGYWVRVRQSAESGLFDIAGHLDLTKRFGFHPSVDVSREISAALDAIAKAGMSVELNTAGLYAPCGEIYPAPSIARGCFERRIPVLITSDAHTPQNIARGYKEASRLLSQIGYAEVVSYAGRRRTAHPLREAG